jgi:hypothetical protein
VATLTAWFVWRAVSLPAWDRALGTDWVSYLRNAMAVGAGHWEAYNVWRGPLYSWLTLAAVPIAATPLAASKSVSIVASAAAIPATWALGRAMATPGAVWGAALLALWPDLEVVAQFSTMYPLLMALLAGGAALASMDGRPSAVAAGVVFGLAGATDLRGAALAVCFVATTVLARPSRLPRSAICAGTGGLVLLLLLGPLPVSLLPLGEQISVQAALRPAGVPSNVAALASAGPHVLALAFVLAPLAMLRDARLRLPLLAPPAAVLASLAFVPVQFRYFVPVAPFVAVLATAGITTVLARAPAFVPALVVAIAGATWRSSDHTMLHALEHGTYGRELGSAGLAQLDDGVSALERAQRQERFERVLDCSALDIVDVLFFPTPVQHPTDDACAKVARAGVPHGGATLLLTSDPTPPNATAWRELSVTSVQDPHGPPEVRFPLGIYQNVR